MSYAFESNKIYLQCFNYCEERTTIKKTHSEQHSNKKKTYLIKGSMNKEKHISKIKTKQNIKTQM